jgi:DNA-directed RNA polymerase specialized sigma24 family protein
MFGIFGGGIYNEMTRGMFNQMPRRDQNGVLQHLYDRGYSGKDISKALEIPVASVYNRIDATRGRGPSEQLAENPA